jgi:hypothetical protein
VAQPLVLLSIEEAEINVECEARHTGGYVLQTTHLCRRTPILGLANRFHSSSKSIAQFRVWPEVHRMICGVLVVLSTLWHGAATSNSSSTSCHITDFGAVEGGSETTARLNTLAINAAIQHCHSLHPSGSTVVVPAGIWRSGSINLTSYLTL